jgi:hypothetical protein
MPIAESGLVVIARLLLSVPCSRRVVEPLLIANLGFESEGDEPVRI